MSAVEVNGWISIETPGTMILPSAILTALRWGIQYRHLEKLCFDELVFPTRELAEFLTTVLVGSNHLKELTLMRSGFPEFGDESRVVSALVSGLRQNKSLEGLVLGALGAGFGDTHAGGIANALELHPSLKRLAIFSFDCDSQTTQALIKLFLKNRKLTDLEFNDCHFSPTYIDSVTKSLRGHPCLARLALNGDDLTDEELNLGSLVEILSTCPKLKRLDLGSNKFSSAGLEMLAVHNQFFRNYQSFVGETFRERPSFVYPCAMFRSEICGL